jgi:hypothetical protein
MERATGSPGRFHRRVVRVTGVIPNAPTPRRDTIQCELECGHARSVLSINRGVATAAEQSRQMIGGELECAKCAMLERIRHKARLRGFNRERPGRRTAPLPSKVAS